MATSKTPKANVLADLFQEKHRQLKAEVSSSALENTRVQIETRSTGPTWETQNGMLNILDYVESSYGLGLKPYPFQRFVMKMYYHLPLDDQEKTIEVWDMFQENLKYRFTEKELLSYLYNEGRCNIKEQDRLRRELVLSAGRRSGKCVREFTPVLIANGLVEMGSLGSFDGSEYQSLSATVVQENGIRAEATQFYNNGIVDTLKIRTHCGYEIEATPEHRIRGMSPDGTIDWFYFRDMKIGDYMGVHRNTQLWPDKPVDLAPYLKDLGGYKDTLLPMVLSDDWATFLGILVGDGTWGYKNAIQVTVGPYPEWLKQVENLFDTTVGDHRTRFPANRASHVSYHGLKVREFLHRLGYTRGSSTNKKRIPWVIMQSPKAHVVAFLRGLFETDGCVEKRGVTFSTASKQLAYELQLLLLNFGIVCRVKGRLNKKYAKTYYHLSLLGRRSHEIFHKEIGFLSYRKGSLLQNHLESTPPNKNKSATESIPYQQPWVKRLVESLPSNEGGRGKSRLHLRDVLGNSVKPGSGEDLTYPRLRKVLTVCENLNLTGPVVDHFKRLLQANYFYDPIVEITRSRGHTVDLSVPDGHSYVAAGFTNHNTLFSSVFASYELYRLLCLGDPQKYYGLPPNNRIQIISVATDKEQASLLFSELSGHINKFQYFSPYLLNNTMSFVNFRTPADIERNGPSQRSGDGKFVSYTGKTGIRATFKSSVAKGLRGAGNIVIVLDELAHFKNKGQSSGKDVYDAVTPSAAAFSPKDPETGRALPGSTVESRIINISSPLGKSGWFYELWCQALSGGEGAVNKLAIQAPTWEMNPSLPAGFLKEKFYTDPSTFMVEFGAQFSGGNASWIEREEDLLANCPPGYLPVEVGIPRHPYYAGLDIGLKNDSTVIAIGTPDPDGYVNLVYHEIWKAGKTWEEMNPHLISPSCEYATRLAQVERLDFDAISEWVEILSKRFSFVQGIFDRWNGIPLEQALAKRGLNQFKGEYFTQDQLSKMSQTIKMLMIDRKLRLYNYPTEPTKPKAPHIQELLLLEADYLSKYKVMVHKPKAPGATDDFYDAYSRMVWLCQEAHQNRVYIAPSQSPVQGGLRGGYSTQLRKALQGNIPPRVSPSSRLGKRLGLRSRLCPVDLLNLLPTRSSLKL